MKSGHFGCALALLVFSFVIPVCGVRLPAEEPAETAAEAKQRAGCINNLKQIGVAIVMFTDDNDDRLPADLEVLVKDNYLPAKIFCCPAADLPRKKEGLKTRYIYHCPPGRRLPANASKYALVTCLDHKGRRLVLYGDGHVGSDKNR